MIIFLQKPDRDYSYNLVKNEPNTSLILACFLTDDVAGSTQLFLPYFESHEDEVGAMNYSQFTKEDGLVTFTPEWVDEEKSLAQGNYFSIKSSTLVELLYQWEKVYAQRPRYITITIEHDIPTIVGSDTPPEELKDK